MIQTLLILIKSMAFFTGSYSINVFKEPLSKDEEDRYIKLMQEGDKHARDELIEHNLRLVAHIVKKFNPKGEIMDDLISIGTIGLIKGIDTYKPSKNTKITTYAARCIQNEILMYYRNTKKNNGDVSLNDTIGFDKEGNEINLIDVLKSPDEDLTDKVNRQDLIDKLNNYIKILSQREKTIIKERYGLDNTKEKTQKEISKNLGISRSYVSRIEKRALTKILKEFIKHN